MVFYRIMQKTNQKIVAIDVLKRKLPSLRRKGLKIAFTNGCFDILHLGHVNYLQACKQRNRILVLGLNSDVSVRKIKGDQRPIVPQKARAGVLAALECIDFVVLFSQETPLKLIQRVNPDILLKGADWKDKGIVGAKDVLKSGGKVEYVKFVKGYSTTDIIEAIKTKCLK